MSSDFHPEPSQSVESIHKRIKLQLKSLPNELLLIESFLVQTDLSVSENVDRVLLKEEEAKEVIQNLTKDCLEATNRLNELAMDTREHIRRNLDQIKYEVRQFKANVEILQRKRKKILDDIAVNNSILMQDFTLNSTIHNRANPNTVVQLEAEMKHNERLNYVDNRLDDMLEMASNSLLALKDQHLMMKMAKTKVLNLAQTLGVSNKVLRMIEKRSDQDILIFCVLSLLSIIFVLVIWRYLR